MNALAIHLYLIINYINLIFNYFGNSYRIIIITSFTFIKSFYIFLILKNLDNIVKDFNGQ